MFHLQTLEDQVHLDLCRIVRHTGFQHTQPGSMKFDRFSDCKCQQHWHRQHRHSDPINKQVAMRHLDNLNTCTAPLSASTLQLAEVHLVSCEQTCCSTSNIKQSPESSPPLHDTGTWRGNRMIPGRQTAVLLLL